MANKMLIDATHPEETRVVVTRGNRVEEFDFESASRKPLRGNIYLAKVTRVEPSLQAAFVEYGGNRHGFLAFSEIHPDYYQIPVADRLALLEDEARAEREEEEKEKRSRNGRRRGRGGKAKEASADEAVSAEAESEAPPAEEAHDEDEAGTVEDMGGGDAFDEVSERPRGLRRPYKIQEVIKRRQILLVQVVKEERGNKGAALTTYLSLAGRYSVLMPNTGRGGGISRKITSAEDRKRLKEIVQDLEVPDGMGIILRTAGASRTKIEIKRDFEYLMRMWESVRELTMKSTSPALVYEEGSLIKRAIRDLYNKDIDEVLVAGDDAYREAKDFMRMMMPSHAKLVKAYKENQPLFARHGIESQLDAMFSNQVTLKSGGYIVINQTEALVSIDVNSGRSTREHNIEDTALKTNLEASEEISRQLRLRDLAGLIVIDFIDMEEKRNNRSVEKKLKDCLKNDRARIQVGRISPFGLLEMSRQRTRTGVLESSTVPCPHCGGTGFLRATPSVALLILRSLEEMLLKSAAYNLTVRTRTEVALYILNHKREHLIALESRFGVAISVYADDSHSGKNYYTLDRGEPAAPRMLAKAEDAGRVQMGAAEPEDPEIDDAIADEDEVEETVTREARPENGERSDGEGGRRRRRRRRRRGRGGERGENGYETSSGMPGSANDDADESDEDAEGDNEESPREARGERSDGERSEGERGGRRRRGRRGGRRNRRDGDENGAMDTARPETDGITDAVETPLADLAPEAPAAEAEAPSPRKRASRKAKTVGDATADTGDVTGDSLAEDAPAKATTKPARKPRTSKKAAAPDAAPASGSDTETGASARSETAARSAKPEPEPVAIVLTPADPDRPKRGGWWARAKTALGG